MKKKKMKSDKYACEQYRPLSEEEKEKKCQYGPERYKNHLENEYRKKKWIPRMLVCVVCGL